jgi:molybdenum cofactor synthesis domain-containing protein
MRIAVLTVSDKAVAGERVDTSGDAVVAWAKDRGYQVAARDLVPDESDMIAAALLAWADSDAADCIVTVGGTGLARRDVTPEATLAVVERIVPGIAEAIRAAGRRATARAALSRGVAGTRGSTLIVNLPGSQGGVRDGLDVLQPILEHTVRLLRDLPVDHA